MKIIIIEDDFLIAEMLKRMLIKLTHTVLEVFSSYEEIENYLTNNNDIDLVFLDINLEQEKNGIDIATLLNDKFKIPFIFLTSYSDPKTIKEASKTLPETYLTKPFNETQLFTALEIVKQKHINKIKTIVINDGFKKIKLLNSDILYVKADGNYIEINTKNKRYIIRNSLDQFIKEFNDNYFTRTHRSYAVNLTEVNSIKNQLIYINNIEIPLSRKYKEHTVKLFDKIVE